MKIKTPVTENHLDHYLELRLLTWARWTRQGNTNGLGFPKRSVIAGFAQPDLPHRNRLSVIKEGMAAEDAEAMEKMMMALSQYKPHLSRALRMYYLGRGSLRDNAMKLGISHTQYKIYVQMAKQWLLGRLSMAEEGK